MLSATSSVHNTGESQQAAQAPVARHSGGLPQIEHPRRVAPGDAKHLSKLFFERLQVLEEGTREYQYVRNTLIEMNLCLVHFVARRFRNRGNGELEDITQVGMVALIKAIDRFDLSREVEFSSFAIPYIEGEIKRYFRSTWAVHVPRRLQELRTEIANAKAELAAAVNRDPTVDELARHLCLPEEEVREGLIAANAYITEALDTSSGEGEDSPLQLGARARPRADIHGGLDPAMELVEDLSSLAPLLEQLDDRQRRVLEMRFGREMTQSAIGRELGCSQMHISRILAGTFTQLRKGLLDRD